MLDFLALVAFIIWKEGIGNFWEQLKQVKYGYIAIGCFVMFSETMFDTFSMHSIRRNYQKDASLLNSIKCMYSSFALGLLTPLQTGYLAGAITYLTKDKMRVSDASTVMLCKTISYMLVQQIFVITMILTQYKNFNLPSLIWVFVAISFFATTLYLFLIILIAKAQKFLIKIVGGILKFLKRVHILKNIEEINNKAKEEIRNLKKNMENIRLKPSSIVIALLSSTCQVICIYGISWFIYKGVSLNVGLKPFEVITGQALCNIIQQIIPIPGGLGVTEVMFTNIMGQIMGLNRLNLSMLIWRVISTYLPITYGLLIILLGSNNKKDSKNLKITQFESE
ncbi:MAG: lysylphosphatidylglycerol synthase transmembrane domain-containing protein [Sphaerochaetaceae bacterium]|nr:lysylphosphatidylglycerol synthase transmembrane domain-containing protein [Sphaerochaetaceae bacterium]